MKTNDIRSKFLKFFEKKSHVIWPSDSLVPQNDPTLLFTGAGMNQFKDMFLGKGNLAFKKATTCQKCLRTGDIDNVGKTASHHTFFEMLGNFSFGDYFKKETIGWAWEFLVQELKIPEGRLSVSVYRDDHESYEIWEKHVGVPRSKIYRYGEKDNFWPADAPLLGPNGPCGPCSEIFFDQGEKVGCGRKECEPACDCDRFVEIWNLVFTQYNRTEGGKLVPLPNRNVDTGMGLERMARVMQGVQTNFDIDIFSPIIKSLEEIAQLKYSGQGEHAVLMRRIADHVKACVFCISDGVLPSNEGRGYVERRLLRRAIRDGTQLGIKDCFLYKLVPVVSNVMQEYYPDIKQRRENIARIVKSEEEKFHETLELGTTKLKELMDTLQRNNQKILSGQEAFKLYDTYGFPLDMTESILSEKGFTVDKDGFENELKRQRLQARTSSQMTGQVFDTGPLSKIKDISKGTEFLGYEKYECEGRVVAIIRGDQLVGVATAGNEVTVILDRTPFYGESGGQIGDTGVLEGEGNHVRIADTKKNNDFILHIGKVAKGELRTGSLVHARIDVQRRNSIRRNHSATHILHYVLRKVIGQHAEQSGSLVTPDRLRFDFHHFSGLTKEEIARIEDMVNEKILENVLVSVKELPIQEARNAGAMALFGEKYGELVRMASVGDFSKELCGGTHVDYSGEIGLFRIVGESSVAAGIRRIEAMTGMAALHRGREKERVILEMCNVLNANEDKLITKTQELLHELKNLQKEAHKVKQKEIHGKVDSFFENAKEVSGVKIITRKIEDAAADDLRKTVDVLMKSAKEMAIVLGTAQNGRVTIVAAVSPHLVRCGLHAGNISKEVAKIVGGGGGGRPDMAQAGGQYVEKLDEALSFAAELLSKKILEDVDA
ncbi:MAG: alanine--tRNA ligase [Candidatus Brocadia sp. AMX2]|uniref:Alanine--tRNA ligase n=1 Tax=Candidatus Brocadia sinica JPN1 TaxID=1197129 RepID=A0ABQ0JUM1_9BACT|nr:MULTISPECIES: alanine--tRNA ligase [Brocadia]KXK31785.1 MAG: alanyl-tRNA synthase [Candidatus Brocadia sinica]MBC6933323.1 alanine--tRNA ligase [Candidatus Brocadia sp.]MBL1169703.1 alanine--tRNA ligase [Candidatus Brocadia sp. AMX1]NOG41647.1 alanine--tRNA ligase [Planctomycetota bacterium]KAA0244474.1 MAG: alanine--tRNA ligase [Candidatus Brocadia sp. AMX2]